MSDVTDEAMDSSAVSEEEVEDQKETSQQDQSSPNKSRSKISAAGEIIEGKRAKKTVERLDFQAPKQKEKLKIGDGTGDKLGDIPRTGFQITKMKPADLKPLHAILFDRPGKISSLKKNLRLFNGFPFDADSEHYTKKREKLLKNSNFTNTKLKVVCGVLDLEKKGTHTDLVDRILSFLIAPKNSGKRLPVKKKRKSKKKLSGDDVKAKAKKKSKPKPTSSSSPKKSKAGSKSKAIVMDSSSDEDDEEEEKAGASAGAEEGSDAEDKPSEKEEEQSDKSEEEEEEEEEEDEDEDEEEEEEESPKSKSARGKPSPKKTSAKRQRTPAKKSGPPKKRTKKDVSDESESDADSEDEKPKKKKPAPTKPAAKTKKADSSSNSRNNTNTAEDSSDDDEPLIKMIKKTPTEDQLKETVKGLLKEANLEEMTMKQICQRVFDTYPEHDLSGKKDFIKQTVKSLIT